MHAVYVSDKLLQKEKKKKEEPSSVFQRQRVDVLLEELARKFPLKVVAPPGAEKAGKDNCSKAKIAKLVVNVAFIDEQFLISQHYEKELKKKIIVLLRK